MKKNQKTKHKKELELALRTIAAAEKEFKLGKTKIMKKISDLWEDDKNI